MGFAARGLEGMGHAHVVLGIEDVACVQVYEVDMEAVPDGLITFGFVRYPNQYKVPGLLHPFSKV
jgi:hypothetical protein